MKPDTPPPATEGTLTADGDVYRLGRRRPVAPVTVAAFSRYLDFKALANQPPPESVDYAAKAQASIARMYLNDREGDCVIAGKAHNVGVWTGNDAGTPALVADATIHRTYQSWCGPGDHGCVITEVLDRFQRDGFPMDDGPHKIDGYAHVDHTNKVEVQVALYLFGALTLGVNLPQAWADGKDVWDVTDSPIVGGHDVSAVGYNPTGVVIATWGGLRTITWAAFASKKWIEECWAMLSPDWYGSDKRPPVPGADLATLQADLKALAEGRTPTVPPVTLTWDDIWNVRG